MKLSDVKKLHQKKYRAQFASYLVEGEHLILELQKAAKHQPYLKDAIIYYTQEHELLAQSLAHDFTLVTVDNKQMASISDTKTPQGILACVPMPKVQVKHTAQKNNRFIYLHEIQDPGNLGTIMRTLAWFGDFGLLLSPNSVDPFNPKVVRASMGAIFHVPTELEVDLSHLQSRFDSFAYLDMQGTPVNDTRFLDHQCYLFGNEARGVPSDTLATFKAEPFTIVGNGNIDSLNVASAVNICAYQLSL